MRKHEDLKKMDIDPPLAPPNPSVAKLREVHQRTSWLSLSTVGFLIVAYSFQLMWSPSGCVGEQFVARCSAEALLSISGLSGMLLLPFLHRDVVHLISNLAFILVLGRALEKWNSSALFISIFLIGAYLSIGIDVFVASSGSQFSYAIGASGATRAMAGFFIVELLLPRMKISVMRVEFFRLPDPRLSRPLTMIVPVVAIYLTALSIGQFLQVIPAGEGIAVVGHFVGSVFGIVSAVFIRQK